MIGLIINLNSKAKNLIPFYVSQKDNKTYIFSYENQNLGLLCEFKSNKVPDYFLKSNILLSSDEIMKTYFSINFEVHINKYFL